MKLISSGIVLLALLLATGSTQAQRIKTKDGNPMILKAETSVNIEFTFDNMSVGKFNTEKEYIEKKTAEYNSKEAGRGNTWAASWENDKIGRFPNKFIELFNLHSGMTESKQAKYTLIFHITSIEPGYNIGISRKNAEIDAEVTVVETENREKVLASITISNAPGGTAFGYDFDTGQRLSEAFAICGKKLAKYMK